MCWHSAGFWSDGWGQGVPSKVVCAWRGLWSVGAGVSSHCDASCDKCHEGRWGKWKGGPACPGQGAAGHSEAFRRCLRDESQGTTVQPDLAASTRLCSGLLWAPWPVMGRVGTAHPSPGTNQCSSRSISLHGGNCPAGRAALRPSPP